MSEPRINIPVSKELHTKVKMKAASERKSMTEIVVKLLIRWLKRKEQ